ncbi:hypothetical protein DPMN_058660 [Dreissena polymorpha]|uniref:Uncharacterized protein n=1 Tax=Dreissena polymorpha TaxID=45954 RepID=A0A9D4C2G0_DREPO|nr:hypothetical protein DPMN_058660 [Dreissena polymorpha]
MQNILEKIPKQTALMAAGTSTPEGPFVVYVQGDHRHHGGRGHDGDGDTVVDT